jgi:hypothetical protein
MAETQADDGSCPQCGGKVWNPLVDWRRSGGLSVQDVACAGCGLTASLVGVSGSVVPDRFQAPDEHVTLNPADIQVEWLESVEGRGGARLVHSPTGIVVYARAHSALADNYHAALQALALQLVDRQSSESHP